MSDLCKAMSRQRAFW